MNFGSMKRALVKGKRAMTILYPALDGGFTAFPLDEFGFHYDKLGRSGKSY